MLHERFKPFMREIALHITRDALYDSYVFVQYITSCQLMRSCQLRRIPLSAVSQDLMLLQPHTDGFRTSNLTSLIEAGIILNYNNLNRFFMELQSIFEYRQI
ncbi:hypothetical protein SAMN05518683_105112 [Salibacterium halotolerans]|uniref:Uncharacterized protein n=1 Tax=Salibacterium halotolerans TaxID=1884432 RepID=A0A1I5QE95_9BACI|nr:hypothetical protein SAMN05518683_105112 [Salibacterium halotolerans]